MSQIQYLQIVLFAAIAAIAFGLFTTNKILSLSKGTKKMIEISGAIQEGAKAYLNRQYTTIAIVGVIIFLAFFLIPFEHILLKKSGKDIDSGRKKKINFATYGTMAILLTIIVFSEFLGAYVTIFLACFVLPVFWGEKNLKLLIPYVILFPLFIILIFNVLLGVYFEPGILEGYL